jgi:hypothetical protein
LRLALSYNSEWNCNRFIKGDVGLIVLYLITKDLKPDPETSHKSIVPEGLKPNVGHPGMRLRFSVTRLGWLLTDAIYICAAGHL